ncbi:MAG: MoaD/ThiS family protein [Cytophagaceae bacterium]
MKVVIRFYGALAELTGISELEVADVKTTGALVEILTQRFPKLSKLKYKIAVNQQLVSSVDLKDNDLVALLPPYSGG